jgi:thioredoxin 1
MEITERNFTEKLEKNSILLVQFWAPWCAPCRALTPTIEALEKEYEGHVGKCNTDENQELAMGYYVRSIPTVIIFKDGEEVERLGMGPKSIYEDKLKYYLNHTDSHIDHT